MLWMNKEGANLRGIGGRIEQARIAIGKLIAAKERFASAPTAASDQRCVLFGDEVRPIFDEIAINSEHRRDRRLDLRVSIMLPAQLPRRLLNQPLNRLPFIKRSFADFVVHTDECPETVWTKIGRAHV